MAEDEDTVYELIINEVQKYPALYDFRSKLYRTHNKEHIWTRIAYDLQVDEETVRKKWKYLRDKFVRCSKPVASGAAASTTKQWHLMPYLHFLRSSCESQDTVGNFVSPKPMPAVPHSVATISQKPISDAIVSPKPLTFKSTSHVSQSTFNTTSIRMVQSSQAIKRTSCSAILRSPASTPSTSKSPYEHEEIITQEESEGYSIPSPFNSRCTSSPRPLRESVSLTQSLSSSLAQAHLFPSNQAKPSEGPTTSSCPNLATKEKPASVKRRKSTRADNPTSKDDEILALLKADQDSAADGTNVQGFTDDQLFLLSLASQLSNLAPKDKAVTKIKLQTVLAEAEFGPL